LRDQVGPRRIAGQEHIPAHVALLQPDVILQPVYLQSHAAPSPPYRCCCCCCLTSFTIRLEPRRDAPRAMNLAASSRLAMPPEALILTPGPTCRRMSSMSRNVAPPCEKPVDVLMKSAPASVTTSHMRTFSSSVSRHVSMMTFTQRLQQAAFTARISASTWSYSPALTRPMLMTMSISSAPLAMASSVSKTLTAVVL